MFSIPLFINIKIYESGHRAFCRSDVALAFRIGVHSTGALELREDDSTDNEMQITMITAYL